MNGAKDRGAPATHPESVRQDVEDAVADATTTPIMEDWERAALVQAILDAVPVAEPCHPCEACRARIVRAAESTERATTPVKHVVVTASITYIRVEPKGNE